MLDGHIWPQPRFQRTEGPATHLQLLNCIMDMVEKTRRSLTVLRRCQEADREELNHWIRCYSDSEEGKKGPTPTSARPLNSCSGPEGSQLGVYQGRTRKTCSEGLLALHSLCRMPLIPQKASQ